MIDVLACRLSSVCVFMCTARNDTGGFLTADSWHNIDSLLSRLSVITDHLVVQIQQLVRCLSVSGQ